MLGGIFFIHVGDFTCLPGEREKLCPGGRLPLNAGELEALRTALIFVLVLGQSWRGGILTH